MMKQTPIKTVSTLTDSQLEELVELYKNEFWCRDRTRDDVRQMLENTDVVIALLNETDNLVGFVRVLTDYIYKATIYDLIVKKDQRGNRLGKLLMYKVIHHSKLQKVRHFDLDCPPDMVDFYEKWGFSTKIKSESGNILHMRRVNI